MIALAALLACTSECAGPACEAAWPAGRLILGTASEIGDEIGVLNLPNRVEGTLEDGNNWSLAPFEGQLFIGMPDRSAVVLWAPPTGQQSAESLQVLRLDRPAAESFGASIAVLDTDGDGRSELWVGAPGYEGGLGAIYRFPDASTLIPDGWDLRLVSGTSADALGTLLAPCGDVTGDGRPDLVVTAPWFAEPNDVGTWEPLPAAADGSSGLPQNSGAVWLLRSESISGVPEPTHPWELGPTWWGSKSGDAAGRAIVCDRDLTGDGLADIAIGAPFAASNDAGRVYIRGVDAGLDPGPLLDSDPYALSPRSSISGWFGSALATRRDPDGDELVISSAGWGLGRGRVALFPLPLRPDAPSPPPEAWFTGPRDEPDHFGQTVTTGDFDGDGASELLVGAPQWRELRGAAEARTRYGTGHAWIWDSANRFRWAAEANIDDEVSPDHELRGNQPFLGIGRSVMFVDLDSDGVEETLLQPVRAPDPGER